jgi:hypothetical protein
MSGAEVDSLEIQVPRRSADDARQHAPVGRAELGRVLLERRQRHTALIDVSSYPAETEVPWCVPSAVAVATRWIYGLTGRNSRRARGSAFEVDQ